MNFHHRIKRYSKINLNSQQKSCKICGSVQCSSCLRFKLKKIKPVCLDCYYDKKRYKLFQIRRLMNLLRGLRTLRKIKSKVKAMFLSILVIAEDVSLLEYRFRQLKGLTEEKPASSENSSLSKTDRVSKLVERYIEEARIDANCSVDFGLDDDPTENENFPSCYMCEGVAEFSCRECDDNFCQRCFKYVVYI
ncbi:unnamed protein product [Schistosoma margrebowiei]|uniref:Uncharacterized protein n=1 Tax=Schistosoma margrebowiei TaxID=48269 RepID=A0A3P8CUX5_9TREM|nr:unnamed protein product [Schistosoma margrebowiei]